MMRRPVTLKKLGISQFFQLPFNVYLARSLPLPLLRCYMYFWGILYVLVQIRMFTNIATCLGLVHRIHTLPSKFLLDLLRSLFGVFEHYFEKLVMAYKDLDELQCYLRNRLQISNKHMLDKLAQEGRGALLVTGHFGAVEYLPLSLAMQGYKVAMICKFKTRTLKRALTQKAACFGVELIDASEPGVAFKAVKAIKEGRFLITECDEFSEWRFHRSRRISVFGMILPQDRTLDFFFKRAKVPTFLTLMKRENDGINLVIEFLADGSKEQSVAATAWKKLEKYILNCPYQWYQIKGASKFLLENALETPIDNKKDQDIPDKDSILSPSYS